MKQAVIEVVNGSTSVVDWGEKEEGIKPIQEFVGGYFEGYVVQDYPDGSGMIVYCHENRVGLKLNCFLQILIGTTDFCGPILIMGYDEEGATRGLSEQEIRSLEVVNRVGVPAPVIRFLRYMAPTT